MSSNIKCKFKVYMFLHPITNIPIYIGQTKCYSIKKYIGEKYGKMRECRLGKRNWSPFYSFIDKIDKLRYPPIKMIIIKEVDSRDESNYFERYYISKFRNDGIKLLNEADGGIGGNNFINKSKDEMKIIGKKISNKLKGIPKPESQKEKLSLMRMGSGNPGVKPANSVVYLDGIRYEFRYIFEICDFIGTKRNDGNYSKMRSKSIKRNKPYLFKNKYLIVPINENGEDIVRL